MFAMRPPGPKRRRASVPGHRVPSLRSLSSLALYAGRSCEYEGRARTDRTGEGRDATTGPEARASVAAALMVPGQRIPSPLEPLRPARALRWVGRASTRIARGTTVVSMFAMRLPVRSAGDRRCRVTGSPPSGSCLRSRSTLGRSCEHEGRARTRRHRREPLTSGASPGAGRSVPHVARRPASAPPHAIAERTRSANHV